jgi:F0F1-type ATP synthase membrane subunit b/b'
MEANIFAPYIQLGFAGFAFLLVFVIVWLIRRLLAILDKTNQIIAGNTEAINRVHDASEDLKSLMAHIRDELFRRPCLLQDSHHVGRTHEDRTAETQ